MAEKTVSAWVVRISRPLVSALAVASVALALVACQPRAEVLTGTKTVCSYGHTVSSNVHTVRVPARDAARYAVKTRIIVCDKHKKLEELYARAQSALSSENTGAALSALEQIIAADPAFRRASQQVEDIHNGKTPKPDTDTPTGGGGTDAGADNPEVTGPVASLAGWVPDEIAGWKAERVSSDAFGLTRQYVSTAEGAEMILTIAVEQQANETQAEARIASLKPAYDRDRRTDDIGGHPAYAATNGRDTAVVFIADGPLFAQLQVSVAASIPAGTLDDLIALAKTLPR